VRVDRAATAAEGRAAARDLAARAGI